jgi:SAM-dependent methyltransferase
LVVTTPPRRLFPAGRRLAKRALVVTDWLKHRGDQDYQPWLPVLVKAKGGHVVIPTQAIESSRRQAADFTAHGLVKPGDVVLDVGAGNGRQAIGLVELGVSRYVGLEIIPDSVRFGNEVLSTVGPIEFDLLDVRNEMYNPRGSMAPEQVRFPYEDGTFDFSVAGSLYTHLETIEVVRTYVNETARVLRPSGTAYMSFFKAPPNTPSSSAVRTVLPEQEVLDAVGARFEVLDQQGGDTPELHNQWRLYLRKLR